jgi:small subunit ribosomal protein S7
MEESSKDDDEPPPPAPQVKTRGASRTASFGKRKLPSSSSAKTPQNSILDLFGPRTKSPKQTRKKVLETAPVVTAEDLKAPVEPEKEANPLTSRNLDGSNTDLADWERDPAVQKWNAEKEFASINEWADSRRWQYEAEKQRVRDQSADPRTRSEIVSEEEAKSIEKRAQDRAALVDYAQRQFDHIHVPPSKSGTPVEFFDQRVRTEPQEPSPWDYFYPPSQLGKPLRTLQAEEAEDTDPYASLLPDAAAKAKKSAVYDPYAKAEKKMKWPFQFNRDELVSKCVNLIMRNGKKATAEKVMQDMFMALMEKYPRQHPVTVFADAIDQNAPLAKTVTFKTGTKLAVVPFALFERQRIRAGMTVLMKAAEKDYTTPLGIKLAKEVIKTMEKNGPGVPFRLAEHKRAMQNKLAIKLPSTRKKV